MMLSFLFQTELVYIRINQAFEGVLSLFTRCKSFENGKAPVKSRVYIQSFIQSGCTIERVWKILFQDTIPEVPWGFPPSPITEYTHGSCIPYLTIITSSISPQTRSFVIKWKGRNKRSPRTWQKRKEKSLFDPLVTENIRNRSKEEQHRLARFECKHTPIKRGFCAPCVRKPFVLLHRGRRGKKVLLLFILREREL